MANWESFDTSRRYLYKADWLLKLIFGAALKSTSIGNLKCRQTAAKHLGVSVSSIGTLFHAYYDVLLFSVKE